jgi:hypothetical protein
MSRISALTPDDREWINDLIDGEIVASRTVEVTEVTRAVVADLREMAEAGDDQAERCLTALSEDGLRGRVAVRLKDDRANVRISHTGSVVSLPTRLGVLAVDVHGNRERHYQQPLWWELTWDRFMGLIDSLERQLARLGMEVAALREIAALRDKYPDTATPLEACERDGKDPRSFGLDRVA